VTAALPPHDEPAEPVPAGRVSNGLAAHSYVPLTDVEIEVGRTLLGMLERARIAAYLEGIPDGDAHRRRLFVAAEERGDARSIVASAVRGQPGEPPEPPPMPSDDPLAGVDTDAAFAELIADWHVDTVAAVRDAQRELRAADQEWRARLEQQQAADEPVWLDEEHFVPPEPPPLPRLAAPTVGAMSLLAVSILLLGLGGQIGLANDLTLLLGVLGVLTGAWMLIMRLRERRDDDEDDDGAIV
jgi:hypothetical protein